MEDLQLQLKEALAREKRLRTSLEECSIKLSSFYGLIGYGKSDDEAVERAEEALDYDGKDPYDKGWAEVEDRRKGF